MFRVFGVVYCFEVFSRLEFIRKVLFGGCRIFLFFVYFVSVIFLFFRLVCF